MDDATMSSPDPLNDFPTYHSPIKPRRSSRARHGLPLQISSPTKQTFELDVGNAISPQKIRVTVEAGETDAESGYTYFTQGALVSPSMAPKNRRRERTTTTTTTIPLKGLSDSEEEATEAVTPKRARGRPRKSTGTPVPAKNTRRAGTPTQKSKRKSIGDLVDGDDEDDINFEIGRNIEVGRGKGRSRSRSVKGARKSTEAVEETEGPAKPARRAASKKGARRGKAAVEEVVVHEDDSCAGDIKGHDIDDEAGMADGFEPIDSISRSPQSQFSTIRSTTTIGGNEPDIVLARFDPGAEIPRRTGWSSPHTVPAAHPSSSRSRDGSYPSAMISPAKSTFSQYEEEDGATIPLPVSDDEEPLQDEEDDVVYAGDHAMETDAVEGDGYQEFDTILESEGFSMISVDSVPSLREHFSSPAIQQEKQTPLQIINKNLLSAKGSKGSRHDDSFSSIPGDVLEAATPGHKAENSRLLSAQRSRMDDSFSSIPPTILGAAPARTKPVSRLLSRTAGVNDSFSSIAPEILEAATPARVLPKANNPSTHLSANDAYDDSFSAIPSAVLEAATPAVVRQERPIFGRLDVPNQRPGSSRSNAASPRLMTPEETPSPLGEQSSDHIKNSRTEAPSIQSATEAEVQADQDSSLMQSHLPSSPPSMMPRRYTYTAHLRQHRMQNPNMTQTPSIIFSSPALPPRIQIGRGAPALVPSLEQAQRPALSPVVRAGRSLQDIMVPSSPRSRSQSLGSPFKSPAANRYPSSGAAPRPYPSPIHERATGPLPRLNLSGRRSDASQRLQARSSPHEDPFRSDAILQQRSPSPEEKQQYSLGVPDQKRYSDPRLTGLRSDVDSVRSEGAMSWQAEEEVSLPGGGAFSKSTTGRLDIEQSPREEVTGEQRWAAERAAVRQQVANAGKNNVIVIDSEDEESDHGEVEDDDDFGLLLETLNSSSPAVKREKAPLDTTEKPRRSKIPSAWRNNSRRLTYSDELHLSSSPIESKLADSGTLSTNVPSQPVTVRRILPQGSSDAVDADLSGWQIPQKSNFQPRMRETGNFDLSAILAASPAKRLPVLTTSSLQASSQAASSSSCVSSVAATVAKVAQPQVPESFMARQSTVFGPIPQKMDFRPRARSDLSSPTKQSSSTPKLFGNHDKENEHSKDFEQKSLYPTTKPLGNSSIGRANIFSVDNTSIDSRPTSSSSALNKEKHIANARTQKWTESLQAPTTTTFAALLLAPTHLQPPISPTKSCLRSPLKTPSAHPNPSSLDYSPSKGVTFVSSSPCPSPLVTLSSTTWSKDHWRLLDTILHVWKPESPTPNSNSNSNSTSTIPAEGASSRRRRTSTRVISRLLGKNVTSEGEKMKLEQWHLEVVDEFRGCVPGWEEKVVAMRVFALIVGAERRRLGLVGEGKSVGSSGGEGDYDYMQ